MIASKLILFFCFYLLLLDNSLGQRLLVTQVGNKELFKHALEFGKTYRGELGLLGSQWKQLLIQLVQAKRNVGLEKNQLARFNDSPTTEEVGLSITDNYADKVAELVAIRIQDIGSTQKYIDDLEILKNEIALTMIVKMDEIETKFKEKNVRRKVKEAKENGLTDTDIKEILFADFFESGGLSLIGGRASIAEALLSSFLNGMKSILDETCCEKLGIIQHGNGFGDGGSVDGGDAGGDNDGSDNDAGGDGIAPDGSPDERDASEGDDVAPDGSPGGGDSPQGAGGVGGGDDPPEGGGGGSPGGGGDPPPGEDDPSKDDDDDDDDDEDISLLDEEDEESNFSPDESSDDTFLTDGIFGKDRLLPDEGNDDTFFPDDMFERNRFFPDEDYDDTFSPKDIFEKKKFFPDYDDYDDTSPDDIIDETIFNPDDTVDETISFPQFVDDEEIECLKEPNNAPDFSVEELDRATSRVNSYMEERRSRVKDLDNEVNGIRKESSQNYEGHPHLQEPSDRVLSETEKLALYKRRLNHVETLLRTAWYFRDDLLNLWDQYDTDYHLARQNLLFYGCSPVGDLRTINLSQVPTSEPDHLPEFTASDNDATRYLLSRIHTNALINIERRLTYINDHLNDEIISLQNIYRFWEFKIDELENPPIYF